MVRRRIAGFETRVRRRIIGFETRVRRRIAGFETRVRRRIIAFETRVLRRRNGNGLNGFPNIPTPSVWGPTYMYIEYIVQVQYSVYSKGSVQSTQYTVQVQYQVCT